MTRQRKKIISIGAAIVFFIVLNTIFYVLFKPYGQISEDWTITSSDHSEKIDVPYAKDVDEPDLYHFQGDFGPIESNTLVLGRVLGYAVEVYINDQYVGSTGSLENPSSNIWNSTITYDVQKLKMAQQNIVDVYVYGIHDIGLTNKPYFANAEDIALILFFQHLLTDGFAMIMIGAMLVTVLIMIYLAIYSKSKQKVYISFALSNSSYIFYNLEFIKLIRYDDLSMVLVYRKFSLLFFFAAMYFLIRAIKIQVNRPEKNKFLNVILIAVLLTIAGAPGPIFLDRAMDVVYLMFMGIVVYGVVLTSKSEVFQINFASTFMLLGIIQSVVISAVGYLMIYNMNYAICTFIMGVSLSIVIDYSKMESRVVVLDEKVKLDPLTKLYNRSVLEQYEFTENDVLVFIDINNFKEANDTYGHDKGDQILVETAKVLQGNIRENDLAVRYAGDEFILLYSDMNEEVVGVRMKRIVKELSELTLPVSISYGIQRMVECMDTSLIKADKRMYDMKIESKSI